jgi:MoaA/NifB/PqqE/SkfB family radical SAM enzyme
MVQLITHPIGLSSLTTGTAKLYPLEYVDYMVTGRCQYTCDFCDGAAHDLHPTGLYDLIVERLIASSAGSVSLCGGEPLLVKKIGEYARRLKEGGKSVTLNTNGHILCRRVEHGLPIELFKQVGISIHGSSQRMQELMQGKGANLEEAVRAAKLVARQPGVALKIATVLSPVNQGDISELARLVSKLGADAWQIYQYFSAGPENTGQERHTLAVDVFKYHVDVAKDLAADFSIPVPVAGTTAETLRGCLLVYPNAVVCEIVGNRHVPKGSLLRESLDQIYTRITTKEIIAHNKRRYSHV